MQLAVDWAKQNLNQSTPSIQSLCIALLSSSPDLDILRLSINNTVTLTHINEYRAIAKFGAIFWRIRLPNLPLPTLLSKIGALL